MNIIFWQNCVSPHQIPYIKEISKDIRVQKVTLITPRLDFKERIEMGWDSKSLLEGTDIEFHLKPDTKTVLEIFSRNENDSYHFFSGIHADSNIYEWFRLSLEYNIIRGIITEPPFTFNKPLWVHKIRFLLQDRKYISKINYVFGIGDDAVDYYRFWSKRWKVISFIYCTENNIKLSKEHNKKELKLVYVGSLSKRKNVIVLLRAFSLIHPELKINLEIIGDGQQRSNLESFVRKHKLESKVTFKGTLPIKEINEKLSNYDVLILPSLYDGWGAVINEAITLGLFCICSDRCSAKVLLKIKSNGLIFRNNHAYDLSNKIEYCYQNMEYIKNDITRRIKWANNISGYSVANYFIENLINNSEIQEPWKNND